MTIVIVTTVRFKLIFFVFELTLEVYKIVIFVANVNRYFNSSDYIECCWIIVNIDQFRFKDEANLNIKSLSMLKKVKKTRVETLCIDDDAIKKTVDALKK